jgi:hypothetical protein
VEQGQVSVLVRGSDLRAVFLLGAGASRGALDHVIVNGKRLKPPLNGDFFQVADTYARAKGVSSEDAKRLARVLRMLKQNLHLKGALTMEEAFSLLYMAKDFPEIYSAGQGRRPAAGKRQEIEDFLRLTFGILSALDQSTVETRYDQLAQALGPSDTVITLNYDTLLDSALVRHGWDPQVGYGLGGDSRKVKWKPVHAGAQSGIGSVRLLKLHGSLNWYVRGSFSNLDRVFATKPVRVERPRKNEVSGHIRQIVPPIYGKFFGHSHWERLWAVGYRALRESECLVVVGCSLVDTDFHLRAHLGRVAQDRKRTRHLFKRLYLADRVPVRRKWRKALKGAFKKTTEYRTFDALLRKEFEND